jgi:Domain of unknown function (DUF397)
VDLSRAAWQKSTYSNANGCVEVAFVDSRVAVRDSKRQDSPVLLFTGTEWEEFVAGIRDKEFDLER